MGPGGAGAGPQGPPGPQVPGPSSLLFSISFPPSLLCLLPSSFPSSLLSFLPFFAPFLPPFLPPSFPFSLSSLLHSLPSSLLPSFLLCRLPSFSPSLLPSSPPSLRPSLPLRAFPSLPPPSPGPAGSHVGSAPSLCRRVPDSDCLMPTLLLPILFRGLPLAFPRSPASRVGPDRSESSALQLLKAQVGKPSQKSESRSESELRVEIRVGDWSRRFISLTAQRSPTCRGGKACCFSSNNLLPSRGREKQFRAPSAASPVH